MAAFMPSLLEYADYAHRIVGPVLGFIIGQSGHLELDNAFVCKVHGIDAGLRILTISHQCIGSQRNSTRENMTAIVIGMLTDQIDTPRRKVASRFLCTEFFREYLFHFC